LQTSNERVGCVSFLENQLIPAVVYQQTLLVQMKILNVKHFAAKEISFACFNLLAMITYVFLSVSYMELM